VYFPTTGDFYRKPTEEAPLHGDRASIVRHEDHLKMEGEFAQRIRNDAVISERRSLIKHEDNLHVEGN